MHARIRYWPTSNVNICKGIWNVVPENNNRNIEGSKQCFILSTSYPIGGMFILPHFIQHPIAIHWKQFPCMQWHTILAQYILYRKFHAIFIQWNVFSLPRNAPKLLYNTLSHCDRYTTDGIASALYIRCSTHQSAVKENVNIFGGSAMSKTTLLRTKSGTRGVMGRQSCASISLNGWGGHTVANHPPPLLSSSHVMCC